MQCIKDTLGPLDYRTDDREGKKSARGQSKKRQKEVNRDREKRSWDTLTE